VVKLVSRLVKKCGVQLGRIGIISPYAAQVRLLVSLLPYPVNTKGGGSLDDQAEDGESLRLT